MSVKDKFVTASEDSFDYSAVFIPLVLAGYNLERNSTPEFGHGGVGYGRYLWHSAVDQTSGGQPLFSTCNLVKAVDPTRSADAREWNRPIEPGA